MKTRDIIWVIPSLALTFTACNKESDTVPETVFGQPVVFEVTDGGMTTRAVTGGDYRTRFAAGDKMGIYAVTGGQIDERFSNRPLTFDGASWSFEEEINYSSDMKDIDFYAYYPYAEESGFDISAPDDPFAGKAGSWTLPADQSDAAVYSAADLMTGTARLQEVEGKFLVRFEMQHRMGLLSVVLPRTSYTFTNTDVILEPYILKRSENISLTSDASAGTKFCFDEDSQSWRLLVKPGTPVQVSASFEYEGEDKKIEISRTGGIGAGKCAVYDVDGGLKNISMELKIGDYYCSDGTLVSYSADGQAPDNAVGVIYSLGTPDAVKSANKEWCHALVYALKRENDVASDFGASQTTPSNTWYESYGWTSADGRKDEGLDGYLYTTRWMSYNGDLTSLFRTSLETYTGAEELPDGLTTGWYLPSYNEFVGLAANAEVLDASLEKAGGESVLEGTNMGEESVKNDFNGYWTSTIRARNATCIYYSLGESDAANSGIQQTGYFASRSSFFRYSFAF